MSKLKLFCDASADPKTGIGFGACILISTDIISLDNLADQIHLQRFTSTTAARLEIQTLIWAVKEFVPPGTQLTVHTDSQTICQLCEQGAYSSNRNIMSLLPQCFSRCLINQTKYLIV